ncbi:uncharacterized protein LOC134214478 [Armigeres subalbatus]|uniref:uncharacterized protein LOC134214478 n=1 Tax=Armigeres subalbatus TaxID=124917 RepID=UPI002ED0B24B
MSQASEKSEFKTATNETSQLQYFNNLASGSFGLVKKAYHKSEDAVKYVVRETNVMQHSAPIIDVTKKAYNAVKDNAPSIPMKGAALGFTTAAIGSAATMNMMVTSAASNVGSKLVRASCIRNSLWLFNKLGLPNAMRAGAVSAGVHANNYIISGLIPGLFTAWAVYDGYRLARFAYNKYQEHQCVETDPSNTAVHMASNL